MHDLIPYRGMHAELYDSIYFSKDYAGEVNFIADRLQEFEVAKSAAVLELACGTGRHALEFIKHQYAYTGIDLSPDMLKMAALRLKNHLGANLKNEDMTSLSFSSNQFHAVVSLFDSIGYLLENSKIIKCFKEVHRVLHLGGPFIFEFWHAPAMIKHFEPKKVREFEHHGLLVRRTSLTKISYFHQTATVDFHFDRVSSSGESHPLFRETQKNRFFQCQEMELLLGASGFKNIKFFSSFELNKPITEETWHVVAVAQK